MIQFVDVTFSYLGKTIFENLSFNINNSEHWAIVGGSDSGTSAFLEALQGKYHRMNGEMKVKALRIARVAAHYHYRNLSTTTEFFYQQRFNMSGDEDADTVTQFLSGVQTLAAQGHWDFERVTNRLNLKPLLDKQLILLSNGETKRVMIAAALIRNPQLLLLDHPLTGLDIQTRKDFNQLITEVVQSGIQVVIATPPTEIPDAITNVAVFEKHRVSEQLTRTQFDPAKYLIKTAHKFDLDELKRLLTPIHERYNVVVGMTNVRVSYGDKLILDNINWTVKQGERWALLGRNGAGKSTLLSLINGDNPQAYANKIVLFDQQKGKGESIWSIKKKIGYVSPELFRYFPIGHTCIDVIESGFYDTLGLFRKPDPANVAQVMHWMKLLMIEEAIGKQFSHVSLSVQRLCLLARALVKSPVLLILDEPCEGLDEYQQENFIHLIDEICKNTDVTLIYVSHYKEQIPGAVNKELRLV